MFTKYAHLFLFLLVIGCRGVQVAREDTPIPLTRVGSIYGLWIKKILF